MYISQIIYLNLVNLYRISQKAGLQLCSIMNILSLTTFGENYHKKLMKGYNFKKIQFLSIYIVLMLPIFKRAAQKALENLTVAVEKTIREIPNLPPKNPSGDSSAAELAKIYKTYNSNFASQHAFHKSKLDFDKSKLAFEKEKLKLLKREFYAKMIFGVGAGVGGTLSLGCLSGFFTPEDGQNLRKIIFPGTPGGNSPVGLIKDREYEETVVPPFSSNILIENKKTEIVKIESKTSKSNTTSITDID